MSASSKLEAPSSTSTSPEAAALLLPRPNTALAPDSAQSSDSDSTARRLNERDIALELPRGRAKCPVLDKTDKDPVTS